MFKIAINLYSLKDHGEDDLDEMFKKVKNAGYDGVETYTLYGLTALELKEKLDKIGLNCVSMHVGYDNFINDIDKVICDAKTLGSHYVVIPWTDPQSEEEVMSIVNFIKNNAALIRESGLSWLYHNHDQEFKILDKGRNFFEILTDNTDNSEVDLQVDTYWVVEGGSTLKDFINRFKSRIKAFHLKDKGAVGDGDLNFPIVLEAARNLAHEWLIVEQEHFDSDPYEEIKTSYTNIRKMEADMQQLTQVFKVNKRIYQNSIGALL